MKVNSVDMIMLSLKIIKMGLADGPWAGGNPGTYPALVLTRQSH